MKRNLLFIFMCLTLATVPRALFAQAAQVGAEAGEVVDPADARLPEVTIEAIRKVIESYRDAWRANNAEAVMRLFTKDAVLLPHHGEPPVVGTTAIRKFWFPPDSNVSITKFESTIDQLDGHDRVAYAWGRFSLSFTWVEGGKTLTASNAGTYLMIFRKQSDGSWLISHRMWDDPVAQIR